MLDTHCHLDHPRFDPDRTLVMQRAYEAGVSGFVVPSVGRTSWTRIRALSRERADVIPCYGVHPAALLDAGERPTEDDWSRLEELLASAAAVGECGLDRRQADTWEQREMQESAFKRQLDLGKARGLPLIVHCVGAHGRMLEMLSASKPIYGGIVHSYTGSAELVRSYSRLGFGFGFGFGVGRPNAKRALAALLHVPLDLLLIESDAPDQAELAWERNEPAATARIAALVASLSRREKETITSASDENALRILAWETT